MASVSYAYDCDKNGGFLPDPNEHKRVGYITALSGFSTSGISFAADMTVYCPYNTGTAAPTYTPMTGVSGTYAAASGTGQATTGLGKAQVVGVIEKFEWEGGAGSLIKIDFYMSQQNATQLKSAQQSTLTTTRVNTLGWWIIDFDQETKVWFEQAFPALTNVTVSGIVGPKDNPELNVDLTPVPARDGIDVYVYKVSIQVAPGANQQFTLMFANSANIPQAKNWGLVVGSYNALAYAG